MEINAKNVGRIAERIAMNELEARGFHIIDLAYMSKTSANVDFIASTEGRSFNVQVKGASNPVVDARTRWWVQYGYCDDDAIERRRPMFNSKSDFALKADVIVLIAVNSPSHYRAIIMPVDVAEEAAQVNLSAYYRLEKLAGGKRKPGKVWTDFEGAAKPRKIDPLKIQERKMILQHEGKWDTLGGALS